MDESGDGPLPAAMRTIHRNTAAVQIAVTIDANYAMPLAAMLASLTALLDRGRPLVIHALGHNLGGPIWDKLRSSLPDDRVEWHRIDVNASGLLAQGFSTRAHEHLTAVTYFRLLLPELLPDDLEKILYLDSDLIVCDDISLLWDTDITAVDLAAVLECNVVADRASSPKGIRYYRELGIKGEQEMFNAGVLLINLERWRQSRLALRAFTYLRELGDDAILHEQEALNVVTNGSYHQLDPRWNVPPQFLSRWPERHVSIVHYLTEHKPWHCGYPWPQRDIFFAALDHTEWAGWRPRAPRFGRSRRLLARLKRAVDKRRHVLRRVYKKLRCSLDHGLVAPKPLKRSTRTLSRRAGGSEIRLFVAVHSCAGALGAVLEAYFLAGVDRALVLDRSGAGEAPLIRPEQRSRLEIFGCSAGSIDVAWRRLLDRHGERHWCVLGAECRMILDENGSPVDLRDYCASLDAQGIDLVEAVTGPGDRLEMIARDLRTGRVFRGTALVAPGLHAYDNPVLVSRAVLVKYRKSMMLDARRILSSNVRKGERCLRFSRLDSASEP